MYKLISKYSVSIFYSMGAHSQRPDDMCFKS